MVSRVQLSETHLAGWTRAGKGNEHRGSNLGSYGVGPISSSRLQTTMAYDLTDGLQLRHWELLPTLLLTIFRHSVGVVDIGPEESWHTN